MVKPRILFSPDHAGIRAISGGTRVGGGIFPAPCKTIADLQEHHEGISPNSGNMIHTEAASKMFDYDISRSCFGTLPELSAGFDVHAGAAHVERRFDAVIISFANIIRDEFGDRDKEQAERRFSTVASYLECLKIPVFVIGVGIQNAPAIDNVWPPLFRLLTAIHKHAALFGVRGIATRDWLHAAGFSSAKAIGCPSLFVFPRNIFSITAPKPTATSHVGTAGHIGGRERKHASVAMLQRIASETVADYVFQNDVFPLCSRHRTSEAYDEATGSLDADFIEPIIRRVANWSCRMFQRYYYFREPGRWRMYAHHKDYYYGDRFHGGVAFLQAGRPALIAGMDARVRELTSFFDLPYVEVPDAANNSVAAMIDERLSPESLDRFKKTYARRLSEYVSICEAAGMQFRHRAAIKVLLDQYC